MSDRNVWIYCRVAGQDDFTLELQKEMLVAYAQQCFFTDIHVCTDHASGSEPDRPGLNEILTALDAGEVDVILVKDLGRVYRDIMDIFPFLLRLREKDVLVLTLQNGYLDIGGMTSTFLELIEEME